MLYPGVQGAVTLDQRALSAVGGRRCTKTLPICVPKKNETQKNFHPGSPHKHLGPDGQIRHKKSKCEQAGGQTDPTKPGAGHNIHDRQGGSGFTCYPYMIYKISLL